MNIDYSQQLRKTKQVGFGVLSLCLPLMRQKTKLVGQGRAGHSSKDVDHGEHFAVPISALVIGR